MLLTHSHILPRNEISKWCNRNGLLIAILNEIIMLLFDYTIENIVDIFL